MRCLSLFVSFLFIILSFHSVSQANWGMGAYGLMPHCGIEVAGGSVDEWDRIDDIEKDIRRWTRERSTEKSKLDRAKREVESAKSALSKIIGDDKADFVYDHIESGRSCGDYEGCRKLSNGKSECGKPISNLNDESISNGRQPAGLNDSEVEQRKLVAEELDKKLAQKEENEKRIRRFTNQVVGNDSRSTGNSGVTNIRIPGVSTKKEAQSFPQPATSSNAQGGAAPLEDQSGSVTIGEVENSEYRSSDSSSNRVRYDYEVEDKDNEVIEETVRGDEEIHGFTRNEWYRSCDMKVSGRVKASVVCKSSSRTSNGCTSAVEKLNKNIAELRRLERSVEDRDLALENAKNELKDTKSLIREAQEDAYRDALEGNCVDCIIRGNSAYRPRKAGALEVLGGLGSAALGAFLGYQGMKNMSKVNAQLGFPTNPAMGFGWPMGLMMGTMGIYGAINGGMMNGYGCNGGFGGMMGPGGLMGYPSGMYPGMLGGGMYMGLGSPFGIIPALMNGLGMQGMGMMGMPGMGMMGMPGMGMMGMPGMGMMGMPGMGMMGMPGMGMGMGLGLLGGGGMMGMPGMGMMGMPGMGMMGMPGMGGMGMMGMPGMGMGLGLLGGGGMMGYPGMGMMGIPGMGMGLPGMGMPGMGMPGMGMGLMGVPFSGVGMMGMGMPGMGGMGLLGTPGMGMMGIPGIGMMGMPGMQGMMGMPGMMGMDSMGSWQMQMQFQQMQMQQAQVYMEQQRRMSEQMMVRQRAAAGIQQEIFSAMYRLQQVQMGVGMGVDLSMPMPPPGVGYFPPGGAYPPGAGPGYYQMPPPGMPYPGPGMPYPGPGGPPPYPGGQYGVPPTNYYPPPGGVPPGGIPPQPGYVQPQPGGVQPQPGQVIPSR